MQCVTWCPLYAFLSCSGLFYLRANERTLDLLKRLEDRLSKQK
jgi:hypothetical protein